MTEAATHMVDNVLPYARYRQIVITLPFPLRYWVATNKKLLNLIHRICIKAIHRKLQGYAIMRGLQKPAVNWPIFQKNLVPSGPLA